jgi:hypothetical protein
MGKVEGKVCSQEGQESSSNECRRQEKVVGVDEGALGSEAKGEGLVQRLTDQCRYTPSHNRLHA